VKSGLGSIATRVLLDDSFVKFNLNILKGAEDAG
jgi:hypothetical protein